MPAVCSSSSPTPSGRSAANDSSLAALSSLVYQSRAIAPLAEIELQRLVAAAQVRNREEAVTGLLVYDQGRFLQWLEGPVEGLSRVWQSIRQDARHVDVAMLGESSTPVRLFGDSAMALAKRGTDQFKPGRDAVSLPAELVESLYQSPKTAPAALAGVAPYAAAKAQTATAAKLVIPLADEARATLLSLVRREIVPQLVARHAPLVSLPLVIDAGVPELVRLLVAAHPDAAFALIDELRADGRSIAQLCAGLFEPAARGLGEMWLSDDCSEFEVTLGLGHLQVALRRASLEGSAGGVPRPPLSMPHAVLVVPSPQEPHGLGSSIASEMFWRAGWDVSCEFPSSDAALGRLLHDRWYDVLDLSLSSAFTREHRLPAMAASIRAAHAHSLNPGLTVIVDGRVFNEQPLAYAQVGADGGSGSALDVVAASMRPLQVPS